jgi:hypothetical protein
MGNSFSDRFRDPDEDFRWRVRMWGKVVPLAIGFISGVMLAVSILIVKLSSPESAVVPVVMEFLRYFKYLIIPLILVPYAALRVMEFYVLVKVRKKTSHE